MENINHNQGLSSLETETPPPEIINREIMRIKRLREDVLLLRFHLARRTDITEVIDDTDRLLTESALKSSLEVLEGYEAKKIPPAGNISAAASALMYAVDTLVNGARMAEEKDATDQLPLPITPESLRASLPFDDIQKALGLKESMDRKSTHSEARNFLMRMIRITVLAFSLALLIQILINLSPTRLSKLEVVESINLINSGFYLPKDFIIPLSGFFWAMVGAFVWILIRFRKFGAAYAFNPSHAQVFQARVFSSAITSAVLLYFVFGGSEPWAKNWMIALPVWAFVLGYAGRLQVELLKSMVERIEGAITKLMPTKEKAEKPKPPEKSGKSTQEQPPTGANKPPPLGTLKKPKSKKTGTGESQSTE